MASGLFQPLFISTFLLKSACMMLICEGQYERFQLPDIGLRDLLPMDFRCCIILLIIEPLNWSKKTNHYDDGAVCEKHH